MLDLEIRELSPYFYYADDVEADALGVVAFDEHTLEEDEAIC